MKTRNSVPILAGILVLAFCASRLPAQDRQRLDSGDETSSRTRAIDDSESRAEKEAERLVSLSPDKIIVILQQEPGLFIEVKKMYVRRAFSQGQIVNAKDLTDDFIFRRVREDQEFCALITQQIV